jgi:general secretion pathway protein K
MALLIVLLLLAVMSVMAISITGYWNNAFEHTQTSQNRLNARWQLLGGRNYAVQQLLLDMPENLSVHLQQNWARQNLALRNDGNDMTIRFRDEQGCFNINTVNYQLSVAEQKQNTPAEKQDDKNGKDDVRSTPVDMARQIFILLLENLGAGAQQAQGIAARLAERLANKDAPLYGDITELRAVPGMTRELYQRLVPLVCAVPVRKPAININTLNGQHLPLLQALFLNEVPARQLQSFLNGRPAGGWQGAGDPDLQKKLADLKLPLYVWQGFLVTGSRYFNLEVRLKPEHSQEVYYLRNLLQYDRKANRVTTLWQYTGQVYD